jgi:hypothetical protein
VSRIKDEIRALASKSQEELIELLLNDTPYIRPVGRQQRGPKSIVVENVLASRVAARLMGLISELPPSSRSRACIDTFSYTASRHANAVNRVLASYEDSSLPQNDESLLGCFGGVCASLFLTAHFCDSVMLCDQLSRIERFEENTSQRMKASNTYPAMLPAVVRSYTHLDSSIKANILIHNLARSGSLHSVARSEVADRLDRIPHKTVKLVAWDSETSAFDFTHLIEGVPIDLSKGYTDVEVYDLSALDSDTRQSVVAGLMNLICHQRAAD